MHRQMPKSMTLGRGVVSMAGAFSVRRRNLSPSIVSPSNRLDTTQHTHTAVSTHVLAAQNQGRSNKSVFRNSARASCACVVVIYSARTIWSIVEGGDPAPRLPLPRHHSPIVACLCQASNNSPGAVWLSVDIRISESRSTKLRGACLTRGLAEKYIARVNQTRKPLR